MGKYGEAAVRASILLESRELTDPVNAWKMVTEDLYGEGTSGQSKSCPKGSFLGLCEAGLVKGVSPGQYTKSTKNKAYAIKAVRLLQDEPTLAENMNILWEKVAGATKAHNSQMDVIISLWVNGSICPDNTNKSSTNY